MKFVKFRLVFTKIVKNLEAFILDNDFIYYYTITLSSGLRNTNRKRKIRSEAKRKKDIRSDALAELRMLF